MKEIASAIADDIRSVLLDSRKFREWKPRVFHREKDSQPFGMGKTLDYTGETFTNLGESPKDTGSVKPVKPVVEQHYSPAELAKAWGVSIETIRCIFREEPGVLKIGRGATKNKRGYFTLRIPESIAERVHRRMAA